MFKLNQSGLIIPFIGKQTKKGGDNRNYFYRVKDLITSLKFRWGAQMKAAYLFAIVMLCSSFSALAGVDSAVNAATRTNGVNFKDRALASCIAEAYKGSPSGKDASITEGVYLEWTYYDFEKGNLAIDQLVAQYLRRDYSNPFEGYEDAKFDLLKCIDMYHSPELDRLMHKYVYSPSWVGDKPSKPKRK